jgi:adenylosuccinate lyase
MLDRLKGILDGLHVYPKRMKENMSKSYGLFTSQRVMLALVEKGIDREKAYYIVQKNAMMSWKRGINFKKILLKDKEVKKYLTPTEIGAIFNLTYYLKNVDYIFKRVFGSSKLT